MFEKELIQAFAVRCKICELKKKLNELNSVIVELMTMT